MLSIRGTFFNNFHVKYFNFRGIAYIFSDICEQDLFKVAEHLNPFWVGVVRE